MGGCPLVFLAEAGMPWPQLWGAIPQHCPGQIYDPPSADSLCGGGEPMYQLVDTRRAVADVERGIYGGRFPSADRFSSGSLGDISPVPLPLPTSAGWCPQSGEELAFCSLKHPSPQVVGLTWGLVREPRLLICFSRNVITLPDLQQLSVSQERRQISQPGRRSPSP